MKTLITASLMSVGLMFVTAPALAMSRPLPELPSTPTPTPKPTPKPTPAPTPKPPVVVDPSLKDATPLWEAAHSQGKSWTTYVYNDLETYGANLLNITPSDAATFCPNYKNLSHAYRKSYWTFLMSSMVRFESNFKPETSYTENFNDSKGNKVISRGLLQISIESGNAYGCGFQSTADLHDARKNLQCGIRILNRWMGTDKRIAGQVSGAWKGGARYWSVLRSSNSPYKSIQAWSAALDMCAL